MSVGHLVGGTPCRWGILLVGHLVGGASCWWGDLLVIELISRHVHVPSWVFRQFGELWDNIIEK